MVQRLILPLLLALSLGATACDGKKRRPLGEACESTSQCASGECISGFCLDPTADDDQDGLINSLEGSLGTNPLAADSDGDGIPDNEEIGDNTAAPRDTDGDGKIDALESATNDADNDCIFDPFDPDDATAETDPARIAAANCALVGACAASGAVITASCAGDGSPAVCDYSGVVNYEAIETKCDDIDNDCNGETDEPFKRGGTVTFDGGPYPADPGKYLGDGCGTGACAQGSVVCRPDGLTLTCSKLELANDRLACGQDANCNGKLDQDEGIDQLAHPLAGCTPYYHDADGDGFGPSSLPTVPAPESACLCAAAGAFTATRDNDCNDADPNIHPGAAGICGLDADCNGDFRDSDEVCDDGPEDGVEGSDITSDGCDQACKVTPRWVSDRDLSDVLSPSIAALDDGGYVIAYHRGMDPTTFDDLGFDLLRFDANDQRIGETRGVGAGLDWSQTLWLKQVFVASRPGGGFLAAYFYNTGEVGNFIKLFRYDADGIRTEGATLQMDKDYYPLAFLRTGDEVVLLSTVYQDVTFDLRSDRFDAEGQVKGPPSVVSGLPSIYEPELLGFDDGSVLLAWSYYGGDFPEIRALRLPADGAVTADDIQTVAQLPNDNGSYTFSVSRNDTGWTLLTATASFDQAAAQSDLVVTQQAFGADDKALGAPETLTPPGGVPFAAYYPGGWVKSFTPALSLMVWRDEEMQGEPVSYLMQGAAQVAEVGLFDGLPYSDLRAIPLRDGFLFTFMSAVAPDTSALFVRRFSAAGVARYIAFPRAL